jgi:hypothetical protein
MRRKHAAAIIRSSSYTFRREQQTQSETVRVTTIQAVIEKAIRRRWNIIVAGRLSIITTGRPPFDHAHEQRTLFLADIRRGHRYDRPA